MSVKAGSVVANVLPPMLFNSEFGLAYSFGIGAIVTFFGMMFVTILFFVDHHAEHHNKSYLI